MVTAMATESFNAQHLYQSRCEADGKKKQVQQPTYLNTWLSGNWIPDWLHVHFPLNPGLLFICVLMTTSF